MGGGRLQIVAHQWLGRKMAERGQARARECGGFGVGGEVGSGKGLPLSCLFMAIETVSYGNYERLPVGDAVGLLSGDGRRGLAPTLAFGRSRGSRRVTAKCDC